jgi:hypothetical protein
MYDLGGDRGVVDAVWRCAEILGPARRRFGRGINARGTPASVENYFEHGYLAITWSDGGIAYWAVSDAAAGELESFVKLFQTAAAGS